MKKIEKKILLLLPAVLLTACSPAKKQQTKPPVETNLSEAAEAPVTQKSAEDFREDSLSDEETGNAQETKEQDTTAQTKTQAGNITADEEFHVEAVYILSDCLFLEVNMADILSMRQGPLIKRKGIESRFSELGYCCIYPAGPTLEPHWIRISSIPSGRIRMVRWSVGL